uniref:uncharacterized protein LOC120344961 n=1 Tax=Styela clava TaxID=7725 RepID=UPI001939CE84|nr:uncharacterized protein LOC120344961 [Styela clava]
MMPRILFVIVFLMAEVQAGAWKNMREFVPSEFFAKFDKEVTATEALGFAFGKDKNFVYRKHPKCAPLSYSSGPDDVCQNEKGTGEKTSCKDRKCSYIARYGSTKCNKMVELYRPIKLVTVECRSPQRSCGQLKKYYNSNISMQKLYPATSGNSEFYLRGTSNKRSECECQTIWCVGEMLTIYKVNGRLFKGDITIKKPCKCDCRKKVTRSTFWK